MKKVLALSLSVILCFALCACAGNPAESKGDMIVGSWTFINGYSLIFNEDNSGKMISTEEVNFSWTYNENYDCYACIMETGKAFEVTYSVNENNQTIIYAWGTPGIKDAE